MKRILFLIALSFLKLFGFELNLNTGREDNQPFAILHIANDQNFTCRSVFVDTKTHFECEIPGVVDNELKDQSFSFFDLKFIKEELKIKVLILPKMQAKMFDSSQNIYIDKEISPSNSPQSTKFTFIFAPELFGVNHYDGLDFDVDFPHESLPYVGALDLNSNPVIIPQSADINTYLRIKQEYEDGNFPQVITDAQNAINRYRNSIFMSEFILYKLRAQSQIYAQNSDVRDQEILENMIEDIKNWTRTFTSDKNYPEVLYIMLKTYIALSQRADVDYTMSLINNQQLNEHFTSLSRLDYADYIYNLGERERAIGIYENIYFNTKDLNLAARAAMSLAKDLLLNSNPNRAIQYINTILKANKSYFGKDISRSLELAKLFYQNKIFDTSAEIYENTFKNMPKIDDRYEEALKDFALALAQTSRSNEAKKYLDLYMDEFLDGKYLEEIRKANDEVFFNLNDNNATFLHQRYKELMKQYANEDENIANRALDEDIKLYYKEGNFSAILDYQQQIEDSKLPDTSRFLEDSAIKALNDELKADNCIKAVEIFTRFNAYNLGQKIENKKQMLSCLQRTSKMEQALAYANENFDEDKIFYGLQKASILLDNKQYQQTINLAQDIINLRVLKSDEELFKAYYLQFLALLRLNDYNQAIKILKILETFPMSFNMVEAYDALLGFASDHNMQTTILNYAPKAIDYQNFRGINLFSPQLEFMYLQALQNVNENDKALNILKDLLKLKLSAEDRARALFIQSSVYEALQNTALQKESLKECLDINATSSWQDLCRQKNQILGE
ncbi:tetratricopeptide repeat protein [Campylobacter cuniculorum]|uniref:tetratricopeptide repeat protein n=1 Tax=Campylobacter cuniculorum TaxID=374106 RepID=UPI0023F3CB3F|nr:flagellar protein [Campylobacter cuniculorum]